MNVEVLPVGKETGIEETEKSLIVKEQRKKGYVKKRLCEEKAM